MKKKVFNWSELHFSEVTSYEIHILVGLLVGKSYHTRQKDGYSLPTNDPTNNRTNWIWMSKKIGLNTNTD